MISMEELPLQEQPDQLLFWEHINTFAPQQHFGGKTAIVGHTPQLNGEIRNLGHVQIIDTFCYGDGWLSAVDVTSDKVWQANNFGDFREGVVPPAEIPPQEGSVYMESDSGEFPGVERQ